MKNISIYKKYSMFLASMCMAFALMTSHTAIAQDTQPSLKSKQQADKKKEPEYVFMETATSGKLKYIAQTDTYQLTLNQVRPSIIYFTHVPQYKTGIMTVEEFIPLMNKNIETTYPHGLNAGLISLTEEKTKGGVNTKRYILTLRNPIYDVNNQTLNFNAVLVEPKGKAAPTDVDFKQMALFIDFCAECSGGGV